MAKEQTTVKFPTAKSPDSVLEKEKISQFPLVRQNFILMAISGAAIIIGFLLMLGGSSTEEAFNPDIFSARRIVVGPTIAFLGFLFMCYAIIRKPRDSKAEADNSGNPDKTEITESLNQTKKL